MTNTLRVTVAIAITVVAIGGAIAFGAWRYNKYRLMPPPAQAVILRDRSDSGLTGCGDTAAMGRELVVSSNFGKGSAIALMVTGDDATASEPVLLDVLEVPTVHRVVEGRSKIAERQKAVVDRIRRRCLESGQTKRSPIYLAVRRAVEYLRAHGCEGRNRCLAYVQSDLEELSERNITSVINERTSERNGRQTLPTPIDNRGIDVAICGLSETAGTTESGKHKQRTLTPMHDAKRVDQIQSVWKELFSEPDRVFFKPHCPKDES